MLSKRILVLIFVVAFLFVGCLPGITPSVTPVIENQAPVITSDSVTTATVGVEYTYDVNATDPDGDTLTYSLTVKPSGMTINYVTGLIWWIPTSVQVGGNPVTVEVSDGTLTDTQSFTIVVSGAEEEEFIGDGYVPTPPVTLTEIKASPDIITLLRYSETEQLTVIAHYSDKSTVDITLDCVYFVPLYDIDIVSVDNTGLVTTEECTGIATITVFYTPDGITWSDTVKVTVIDLVQNTDTGKYYHTIQEAINDDLTLPGHTIEVAAGTYNEHIVIDKQLTLLGANTGVNPVIGGRGDESIIEPTGIILIDGEGSGTIFDGFTVEPFFQGCIKVGVSATISNNIIHGNLMKTITVGGVDNVTIMNNLIPSGGDAGIYLYSASNCLIEGNKITGLSPINPPKQWGAISFFTNCQNNIITHNILADNVGAGVSFLIAGTNSSGNKINNNNIYGNMMGVRNIAKDADTHPRDATNNWWGNGGTGDDAGKPGEEGNNDVEGNVNFEPWLTSPY